jgi:acyl-CoA reductase-like NAD-dependent aldehyde dehydrogenase
LDSTPVGFIPTQLERFSLTDPLGNSSAAESPFGGIKQSGYGKESGKDVAVNEYLITKTGTFTLEEQS